MLDYVEIHRLALSEDAEERKRAVYELITNFAIFNDKEQAWDDLHSGREYKCSDSCKPFN